MKASEIFEGENSSLRKTFDKIHTGDSWRRGFLQGAKEMKHEMSEAICEIIVQTDWANESAKGVDRLSKLAEV